ncbi:hypothetical protein [Nodosilinea sp. PGN35]|uniref:hypothetical protein n=1 Tax=Nodosilinea sp. PGN35 TaxID=3020489 RepID=UPI0023B218E4|nr:hypothetical protein [Nodosilinea sp. TSF1-S3]MDF0369233.1 hypothetical protein [Nodosilinea sp. TSF1-S3]
MSVKGYPWGAEAHLRWQAVGLRLGYRQLWQAIAGASLLLLGGVSQAQSEALNACADQSGSQAGIVDAACCPDDLLSNYWPKRSPQLNKTFCQLLVFPTASLPNGEDFTDRIVDGSLSSDSRHASADRMTLPSLWWNRDSLTPHLGGRRLVQSWISYQIEDSGTAVVDVMINPQMWSVLTYNEQYAVLNQFGTAARSFGHNLRFFQGNSRSYRMVGLYACDFADQSGLPLGVSANVQSGLPTCSANLDPTMIVQLQRNLLAEGERRYRPAPTAQAGLPEGSL